MPAVEIAGVGLSNFTKQPAASLTALAAEAIAEAMRAASTHIEAVDEVFVGNARGTSGVAARLADDLAIRSIPVTRVEQACASGSTALRLACDAVRTESARCALVVGLEATPHGLLLSEEPPTYADRIGASLLPGRFALKADQYLTAHGLGIDELSEVAVIAKRAATLNPKAAYGKTLSVAEVSASPPVSLPFTRLHCCGPADGAAAAIVRRAEGSTSGVRVLSYAAGFCSSDPGEPPVAGVDDLERIVERLAASAYERAGLGPDDVDVCQINDAFTISVPLYLEALGFAAPGTGIQAYRRSSLARGASGPGVNTDGGLLGRGHALGATAIAMLYELWQQLRGNAGARQVEGARTALLQSHGRGADNVFLLRVG